MRVCLSSLPSAPTNVSRHHQCCHHGPDLEKLGPKDAIKARESWGKIGPLLKAAFCELREYEYFGPRAPVPPAYTVPAAVLPLKLCFSRQTPFILSRSRPTYYSSASTMNPGMEIS